MPTKYFSARKRDDRIVPSPVPSWNRNDVYPDPPAVRRRPGHRLHRRRASAAKSSISVGISVGTTEKIFDVVKQVAARDGLEIKLVKFNDYQLPNAALNAGDLDANAFQHKPFLDNQIKARGFDIVPVGLTVTAPLGFYSRKIKALGDLPEGASVGIQNDPSNGNRALRLLAAYKLITLKPEAEQKNNATPQDVVSNPRKLKLVPLDAAQLPRSLDDLTAAAINNDYADQAGLVPARDAIGREAADGPYANLIAVRAKDRDQPWVRSWWRLTSRPRSAPSSRKNSRARWCPRSDASGSLFRIPDIRRHTMSIITLAGSRRSVPVPPPCCATPPTGCARAAGTSANWACATFPPKS